MNGVTFRDKGFGKGKLFIELFGELVQACELVVPGITEIRVKRGRLSVLDAHTGFHRVLGDTVQFGAQTMRHVYYVINAGTVKALTQIGNRRAVLFVLAVRHGKQPLGQSFVFVPGRHFVYCHATVFTVCVGVCVADHIPVTEILLRHLGGSNLDSCFHD